MKVAVLGWGSLIWQPEGRYGARLATDPDSDWSPTGPELPVEFARISSDGRLTLVIVPGYEDRSRTSWILSTHQDFEATAENLADREGIRTPANRRMSIHGITNAGLTRGRVDPEIADAIRSWMQEQKELDAAVWTGLGPGKRWTEHGYRGFTVENALHHLEHLEDGEREAAIEYFENAPPEIDTPVRRRFEL